MKPYPKYKDSGVEWIGEVPEGWEILPIKYVVKIPVTDGPHETPELLNEGIPFISAEAIKNDKIDFGKKRGFISIEEHKRFSKKYKPQKGDIYMIKSGATTGNVAVVETDDEFNIWSPLAVIRPDLKKTTTKFLFHFMKSINFFESIELGWSFGTQQNIGMGVIENLPIVAPSIEEQISIAAYLDRKTAQIDNLISKKQKLIELLKEKRSAIINQAVTKGLNPDAPMKKSGIEWLGEVPEHWEVKRLKYFFRLITEKNCSLQTKKVALENIESWTGRFIDSEVDYQGEGISFLKGDILFGKLRPYLAKVLNAKFSGASVGDIFVMRPKLGISSRFAFYRFLSKPFIDIVNGSTFGAKMPRVSWDFIANLHIAMPNNKEQRTISGYLDSKTTKIDQTISRIEKQTDLLQEFRTALISEAVTGKIDVRDGGSNG